MENNLQRIFISYTAQIRMFYGTLHPDSWLNGFFCMVVFLMDYGRNSWTVEETAVATWTEHTTLTMLLYVWYRD
jgi:hypothetical protein